MTSSHSTTRATAERTTAPSRMGRITGPIGHHRRGMASTPIRSRYWWCSAPSPADIGSDGVPLVGPVPPMDCIRKGSGGPPPPLVGGAIRDEPSELPLPPCRVRPPRFLLLLPRFPPPLRSWRVGDEVVTWSSQSRRKGPNHLVRSGS